MHSVFSIILIVSNVRGVLKFKSPAPSEKRGRLKIKPMISREQNENVKVLLEDIRDSKGLNKEVIHIRNIKANTELANKTLKKIKNDFKYNILYILLGFFLSFVPQLFLEDKKTEVIELMNTLLTEKQKQSLSLETEVLQMRLEISSLKNKLDSLR